MLLGLLGLAVAADFGPCTTTSVGRAAAIQAPAVLVLGERKGTQPDLKRAYKIVKKLAKQIFGSPRYRVVLK